MPTIQNPAGVNIGVNNPGTTAYLGNINAGLPANDTTDGSIRLKFDDGDAFGHIALRANGVWNDTGFRISSSSLALGLDMLLSAIAGFLQTINPSAVVGHQRSLIPHIQFDDATGTIGNQLHIPITNATETFVLFSGAVGETTGTTIGQIVVDSPGRVLTSSIHEVGSVGASAEVTVKWFVGSDNTGTLINKRNLPSSDLVANSTLTIDYDEDFGLDNGVTYFQEFTSTAAFSLKTDSGGNILITHVGHELAELDGVSENLMLDEGLDFIFDKSLNPMYSEQFP